MFKLIVVICLFNLVLSEKNITCPDKRICFSYIKYEEHCEIYTDCNPPCDLLNCSIIVENDVDCEHFVCFNVPDPEPKKISIGWDLLYGSVGSISTSFAMIFFWFSFKKLLLRWKRRSHSRQILENDDISINEQETSTEIEGDAISRPIIRNSQAQAQVPVESEKPKERRKNESGEASSSQKEIKVIVEDEGRMNLSMENAFYNPRPNFRPIFEESDPVPGHDKFDSKPPSMDSIEEAPPDDSF